MGLNNSQLNNSTISIDLTLLNDIWSLIDNNNYYLMMLWEWNYN